MLDDFFIQNRKVAVAYSGGVDSSYLLFAAKAAGCDVHAYYMKSRFQPDFEYRDALRLAESINVPVTVDRPDVLSEKLITENTADRCYYCKHFMLDRIRELAQADGYSTLCDGTNADDDAADRPGMRALREQGVVSPLRDCGLSKAEIRSLSEKAGLFTHCKPAYSCLATRIPAGETITERYLEAIGSAENSLFGMGFSDFRVRLIPPDGAKLQFPAGQWEAAAARRSEILAALRPCFTDVMLDLAQR